MIPAKNKFIVVSLSLSLLGILAFYSGFRQITQSVLAINIICNDPDQTEWNEGVAVNGICSDSSGNHFDYCDDEYHLEEWQCLAGSCSPTRINCSDVYTLGRCQEGRCINPSSASPTPTITPTPDPSLIVVYTSDIPGWGEQDGPTQTTCNAACEILANGASCISTGLDPQVINRYFWTSNCKQKSMAIGQDCTYQLNQIGQDCNNRRAEWTKCLCRKNTPIPSPTPTPPSCLDSDGGQYPLIPGTCDDNLVSVHDLCFDQYRLDEASCSATSNQCRNFGTINCQTEYGSGYRCLNGIIGEFSDVGYCGIWIPGDIDRNGRIETDDAGLSLKYYRKGSWPSNLSPDTPPENNTINTIDFGFIIKNWNAESYNPPEETKP
ncbi:MAG: hypothetical protein JW991_00475 [Candidatus Pacebacteria bacterium]|nr:hypothetical protein [Candidatus Paceibacterota bacterium]